VVIAVGAILFYLQSPAGQRRLRQEVLDTVNGAIAGRLEIGGLELDRSGKLVLTDAALYDPDGKLVARIQRIEAQAVLLQLVEKRIHLERVDLRQGELLLAQGPAGLNLAHAVAARQPSSSSSPGAGKASVFSWDLTIDGFAAAGIRAEYRLAPDAAPAAEVREVQLEGSVRYRLGGSNAALTLSGLLSAPVAGPLTLEVAAHGGSWSSPYEPLTIDRLDLLADASRLRLTGTLVADTLQMKILELAVTRRDLLALVPDAPLASDVSAIGEAAVDARHVTAALRLTGLTIGGAVQFSPLTVGASVSMAKLDLSTLITGAPVTLLDGTVNGHFAFGEPAPGTGELTIKLEPSLVRGVAVEQLSGTLALREKQLWPNLVVAIPGGRAEIVGSMGFAELDLKSDLVIADLGALSGGVAQLAGGASVPPLQGAGSLTAKLTGSAQVPTVQLSGSFGHLQASALAMEGLVLKVQLPNARHPFVVEADVRADKGAAGPLHFTQLDADVHADGRRFGVDLTATGVTSRIAGVLDQDLGGGRLEELTLTSGDASWQLEQPAVVDLRDGARVDLLALRSGDQTLQLRGGVHQSALDLQLEVDRLDLAKLPEFLTPPDWGLAGTAHANGHLGGTLQQPKATATITATRVAGFGLDEVEISAEATLASDRILGSAHLKREQATLVATVDLPLMLLGARPSAPASGSIDLLGLPLPFLAERLKLPKPRQGLGGLRARLSGTVGNPRLEATATLDGATWDGYPEASLVVDVDARENTSVKADLKVAGGTTHLDATGAISLRGWIAPPSLAQLRALPVTARLLAPAIVLKDLSGVLLPDGISGTASLDANLKGSFAHPRGEVELGLKDGVFGTFEALSCTATLTASDKAVEVSGEFGLAAQRLAHLDARFAAPVEALESLAALWAAPITAKLEAGPVDLAAVLAPGNDKARGTLTGRATLSRTLADPVVEWQLRTDELHAGQHPTAQVQASGGYREKSANATLHLGIPGAGLADAQGTLGADLSLPSLVKGVAWAQAAIVAHLDADALDLSVLDGWTRSLRSAAGILSGHAEVSGTLGVPTPRGSLKLRGGAFALGGYGAYRDVSFDLSASDRLIDLSALSARAGDGSLSLTFKGERASAAEPYRLTAQVTLSHAPLIIDGQLVARLTAETKSVTGELQGARASLAVKVARLIVELPMASTKDLQSLDPDPTIVIVDARAPKKKAAPAGSKQGGFELVITASAPGNLWVQSSDAKIEASTDLRVVLGRGDVQLGGTVQTLQGHADVLGRRFEIAVGQVTWSGGPLGNPQLDLHALYANAREQVKVRVHVTGAARAPKVDLSSEPPLDEQQIAALLATGRRENKRGATGGASGGGAASVLTSVAADKLRRVLATRLPLDVLQVGVGDKGLSATQVEAGTFLTDRIYVGYLRNFGAETDRGENTNEARIEYQLTPAVSLETEYGDAGRGGAGVVYTLDY